MREARFIGGSDLTGSSPARSNHPIVFIIDRQKGIAHIFIYQVDDFAARFFIIFGYFFLNFRGILVDSAD